MQTKEIEGIDLKSGLARFGGKLDIYLRVLNSFLTSIPPKLARITEVCEENLPDYAITIHGIKGSCYGISANNLGKEAEKLEVLAIEKNIAEIQKLNPQFLKSAEKLLDDLKNFAESERSANPVKKNKAEKPDSEILRAILTAAQNYDNGEINKYLGELCKFDYKEGGDLVSQIKKHAENFDYEALSEVIENYLKA